MIWKLIALIFPLPLPLPPPSQHQNLGPERALWLEVFSIEKRKGSRRNDIDDEADDNDDDDGGVDDDYDSDDACEYYSSLLVKTVWPKAIRSDSLRHCQP